MTMGESTFWLEQPPNGWIMERPCHTEGQTRTQLLDAYRELLSILKELPNDAGYGAWPDELFGVGQ